MPSATEFPNDPSGDPDEDLGSELATQLAIAKEQSVLTFYEEASMLEAQRQSRAEGLREFFEYQDNSDLYSDDRSDARSEQPSAEFLESAYDTPVQASSEALNDEAPTTNLPESSKASPSKSSSLFTKMRQVLKPTKDASLDAPTSDTFKIWSMRKSKKTGKNSVTKSALVMASSAAEPAEEPSAPSAEEPDTGLGIPSLFDVATSVNSQVAEQARTASHCALAPLTKQPSLLQSTIIMQILS
jgi:hypothetical protein